ncbi:MAG: 23S rRNA (guanosine(2251)-2'-O)-methyltransferase RlmB [Alphaproteobacteria bacterium]
MAEMRKKIRGKQRRADRGQRKRPGGRRELWLYGRHAVLAALANPERDVRRVMVARGTDGLPDGAFAAAEQVGRPAIEAVLAPGAVHQGLAAEVEPLAQPSIEDIAAGDTALLVVLDQVTDPQNIGAVLRSAAVFGAGAVIVPDRHAPEETGALAKAASGALEQVPLIRVTNLARALEQLKQGGFWCIGLDSDAPTTIEQALDTERRALVMGAEGAGLRRLTRENCDALVRIYNPGGLASLNVSNATAVALYALTRDAGST